MTTDDKSRAITDADRLLALTSLLVTAVCLWSYLDARDPLTWWMEALPVLIVYPLFWAVRGRFRTTGLLTLLIAVLAGLGAVLAQVLLGRAHDRKLKAANPAAF